ncbi:MAG: flagellar hook-basal body protein [Planctomycetota bacterium]|jgi:flagellar basal body rod protein FlgG
MSELTEQNSLTLNGLTHEFNIIAHNLANVSTVGYKRKCNAFSKSLTAQGAETEAETGDAADLYATFDFSQGSFIETNRSLDFALCGKGFFVIETPNGPLYTRNGVFRLNQNGQIADSAGRIVAGQDGPISIPPDVGLSQISVSSDGSISAAGAAVGKFKLVDFKDKEDELIAAGLNCFHAPETAEPQPPENLIIKQGFQENSNVQMVEELVDMIMVTRLYEANVKFISVGKDISESLMNVAMG